VARRFVTDRGSAPKKMSAELDGSALASMRGEADEVIDRWVLGDERAQNPVWRVYDAREVGRDGRVLSSGRAVVVHGEHVQQDCRERLDRLRACRHPAVIHPVLESRVDGWPVVVMQRPKEPSVAQICRREGAFNERRTVRLGIALAEVLAGLHGLGLIHGALTWGCVHPVGRSVRISGWRPVLPGAWSDRVAPEVREGAPARAQADLWSLGRILANVLDGRPTDLWRGDGALGRLVMQLLSADPAERPRNATVLLSALARLR